jgi:hypothetical protein
MLANTPLIGQADDFEDLTTENWTNGAPAAEPVNTAGGPGGAADRFLQVSSAGIFGAGSRLAVFNVTQWIGNYVNQGMTSVEMDLKNFTASPVPIRIALRTSPGGGTTPGYASTTAFSVPADNAWHHAVFSLDAGSLTAINSPPPLSTFLTAVGDFRIILANAPALIGDVGTYQIGVDNITAVGQAQLYFQQTTVALPEGNSGTTPFVFNVSLSSVNGGTVQFATSDGSATAADNDYVPTSGTLSFTPGGATTLPVTVVVNGDTLIETDQGFAIDLDSPTNAVLGASSAQGTIQNDDFPSTIAARRVFYNQSAFDGNNASINANDDNAIATDKSAYLPGAGVAAYEHITNYSRGINGIIVDIAGGGLHASINANDFVFKVGNNNSPSTWAAAAAPTAISVRTGAGTSGSDRVEITWAANAVKNTWLEVQVLATVNTGLSSPDVFFWGNRVGDTTSPAAGGSFVTNVGGDGAAIVGAAPASSVGITNRLDVNKSNTINVAGDRAEVVGNSPGSLLRINIGTGGPFAPAGDNGDSGGGDAGVASALAGAGDWSDAAAALPPSVAARLDTLNSGSSAVTAYHEQATASDDSDDEDDAQETPTDDELLELLAGEL